MVAIIFFQVNVHIWLTTPRLPVRICSLLPEPLPLMYRYPLSMAPKAKVPHAYHKYSTADKCRLNYKGSYPTMKKVGAGKIFKQSVTQYSLQYTSFYGHGDSTAFPAVENACGPEVCRKV